MRFVAVVLVSVAAALAVSGVAAQWNIPSRYDGFQFGNGDSPVLVEAFLDMQCSACRKEWPELKKVMAKYAAGNKVRFVVHTTALPFHRNAFELALGVYAVSVLDETKALDALDIVYTYQSQFLNDATFNKSRATIRAELVTLLAKLGVDEDKLTDQMNDEDTILHVEHSWAFSSARGVWRTPTVMVNGVVASSIDSSFTYDQWCKLLDSL